MCRHLLGELPTALALAGLFLVALLIWGFGLLRRQRNAKTTVHERTPTIVIVGESIALVMAFVVLIVFVVRCL